MILARFKMRKAYQHTSTTGNAAGILIRMSIVMITFDAFIKFY